MPKVPRLAGWVVAIIVAAATELIKVIGKKATEGNKEKADDQKRAD